jgi:hypothetical protein
MICPNCKTELEPGKKFCGSCGFDTSKAKQAGDEPEPETPKEKLEEMSKAELISIILKMAAKIDKLSDRFEQADKRIKEKANEKNKNGNPAPSRRKSSVFDFF